MKSGNGLLDFFFNSLITIFYEIGRFFFIFFFLVKGKKTNKKQKQKQKKKLKKKTSNFPLCEIFDKLQLNSISLFLSLFSFYLSLSSSSFSPLHEFFFSFCLKLNKKLGHDYKENQ